MVLRPDGTIRADGLDPQLVERGPGIPRPRAAKSGSFFRIGKLGNDRELLKRTYGPDRCGEFLEIAECFQDEKIHAAFFECFRLLPENFPALFDRRFAYLSKDPQRPDRARDQDLMLGCFPRLARDLNAPVIELCDAVFQAERAQFVPVGSKCVGLDDMSAGFQVGHVNAKDGFRARGIQFVHAALRSEGFVE
jgi:hypothetical protein